MPSIDVVLSLSNKKYGNIGDFNVLSYRFFTGRPYDHEGKAGKMRAIIIEVEIVVSPNEILIGSVFGAGELLKGSVQFNNINGLSGSRNVKFDDSTIVEYDERYEPATTRPTMILKLTISVGKVDVDGGSMSFSWASG